MAFLFLSVYILIMLYKYIPNLDPGSLKYLLSGWSLKKTFANPWFIHEKNKWFSALGVWKDGVRNTEFYVS